MRFLSELVGVVLIACAFAWGGFDVSQHAGRVSMLTLVGSLVLAAVGGWLISKRKTLELLDFLFVQATRARTFKLPSAGSGDEQ